MTAATLTATRIDVAGVPTALIDTGARPGLPPAGRHLPCCCCTDRGQG